MSIEMSLDVATEYVAKMRWPEGVTCPRCEGKAVSYLSTRRVWKCKGCKKQFSVKVGTIFEDSPIGLDKWLAAVWMIANDKNGISSYKLGHILGVTQKTAWKMIQRLCPGLIHRDTKRQGNPIIAAKNARRRAMLKNACPSWVSKSELEKIYKQAALKTAEAGISFHVDHIIPLVNQHVCGLHVPWNLQIIPQVENQKKLNTFDLAIDFPNPL